MAALKRRCTSSVSPRSMVVWLATPTACKCNSGSKPWGIRAFELFQKFLLVAALEDVLADIIGLREVEHDQIMSAAVGAGLGAGGLGFLVPCLAVNDARDAFLGILPDAFPDAHHVAAGGVHEHAALFFKPFARADLGAKRGNHHHVAGVQPGHFLLGRLGRNDLDAHVADLVVDLGVVDDFAEQINGLFRREIFPRGVDAGDVVFDPLCGAPHNGSSVALVLDAGLAVCSALFPDTSARVAQHKIASYREPSLLATKEVHRCSNQFRARL